MQTLWRRWNYRRLRLDTGALGTPVKVLERDGRTAWCAWQGFLAADAARQMPGMRAVRLVIERVDDRVLDPDEYVKGARLDDFAWAVLDQSVSVVGPPTAAAPGAGDPP